MTRCHVRNSALDAAVDDAGGDDDPAAQRAAALPTWRALHCGLLQVGNGRQVYDAIRAAYDQRQTLQVRCSPSPSSFLEVGRFLKIRNRESRFLLPDREMRNWKSENDSFSIPFMIPLLPIPSKCAKNGQGIGIAIL